MRALWIGILLTAACGADSSSQIQCDPPATYLACGCGCCGGLEPGISCVDEATMCKVISDDQAIAGSSGCAMAGCAWPVQYELCDAQPR